MLFNRRVMSSIPDNEAVSGAPSIEANQARRVALIVAVAFFMQLLDSTIISTSLPQMGQSFGVAAVAMSIGITVYMLTMAVFVPLSGWLADRFGARNVFLVAIALFTLASLACGFSQNLTQFVAARAVQGLGSALMTPVGRILVLRNAPKSELLNATALITWPALFAPVVGPVLGGFITTYLSWHWNFFINIPLGLIGLALVGRFIPGDREADAKPLDWPGFFLTSLGLACLLYGLERIAHPEDGIWPTLALLASGIVIGWLAVRHLNRAPHPLLDLSSLKVQTFAISTLAAGTIFRVVINATPFLLPLLFQVGLGLTPVDAGLMILAYFLGNLGMKTVTTPTLRRFGFRSVMVVNGILAAASIMACGVISPETPRVLVVALMLIAGLSRSMQFTALNTLAFADIAAAQRSSAATLSSMLQQISMLFGVAVAAAILNLSQIARARPTLDLVDFRVAFLVIGAIGLVTALRFLVLPADAGAEVSGHSVER